MKYQVFINGGFANIPKKYAGEITLKEDEKKELLKSLGKKREPSQEIHDGFIYHVKVIDGQIELNSVFDEHNLPEPVRSFMETVRQKNKDAK